MANIDGNGNTSYGEILIVEAINGEANSQRKPVSAISAAMAAAAGQPIIVISAVSMAAAEISAAVASRNIYQPA